MTISLLSKRRTRYFFFAGVRSSCLFTNVSQPFSRSLMLRCPEDIRKPGAHQGLESHCPVGKVALTWLFRHFRMFFSLHMPGGPYPEARTKRDDSPTCEKAPLWPPFCIFTSW